MDEPSVMAEPRPQTVEPDRVGSCVVQKPLGGGDTEAVKSGSEDRVIVTMPEASKEAWAASIVICSHSTVSPSAVAERLRRSRVS